MSTKHGTGMVEATLTGAQRNSIYLPKQPARVYTEEPQSPPRNAWRKTYSHSGSLASKRQMKILLYAIHIPRPCKKGMIPAHRVKISKRVVIHTGLRHTDGRRCLFRTSSWDVSSSRPLLEDRPR